jgi:hypothetical protein
MLSPIFTMDIYGMSKDELHEYAKANFGVTIDRRKKLQDLQREVEALGKPRIQVQDVPVAPTKKLRNKRTGVIWDWNPVYADNPDLEPYYEG